MRPWLAAIVAGLGVIASACSTAPDEPTVKLELARPELPEAARQRCADPVTLPDRDLTESEVTSAMGRDRAALRICETRRAAAVAAVEGAMP